MADVRRSCNRVNAADHAQRALEADVALEAAVAYWELSFAEEQVTAREKARDVAADLLADQETRLSAGVTTTFEVADARAGLEQRRGDLAVALSARRAAADDLRSLILPFTAHDPGGVRFVAADDPRAPGEADPAVAL